MIVRHRVAISSSASSYKIGAKPPVPLGPTPRNGVISRCGKPEPLVARRLCRRVAGRMSYRGDELAPLDLEALPAIVEDFSAKACRPSRSARCSPAFTARRSTARPRSRRPAMAWRSKASRSTRSRAARGGGAAARVSKSATARARTITSSPRLHAVTSSALESGRRPRRHDHFAEVIRTDGTRSRHVFATGVRLDAADVVRVVTGNGAGWGDPALRAPAAIRTDLSEGLLTADWAREVYGFAEDAGASHD